MLKFWTLPVVAVALLGCIIGLEAQEMVKGSQPPSQSDPPRWSPPNVPRDPSTQVFPQAIPLPYVPNVPQSSPDSGPQGYPSPVSWNPPQNLPSSQVYLQRTPGNLQPSQAYPANPEVSHQWNQPQTQPGQTGHTHGLHHSNPPVIRPVNPSPTHTRHQWRKPEVQPVKPLPAQSGSQPSQPADPAINQWTRLDRQPALPSQSGSQASQPRDQWSQPIRQPATLPLPSQPGTQWTGQPKQPADPSISQTRPASQPVKALPAQPSPQWTSQPKQPADPSTSGYPKVPQWPTGSFPASDFPAVKPPSYQQSTKTPQTPIDPSVLNCNVATQVRVPCGPSSITADRCQAINCCFDGQSCYFGKAVTVQCTKDGQFIVVVSRDSTLPLVDLTSTSLLQTGQGCSYVDSNSQFVIYQFPVTTCGSIVTEDSDAIVYENRLSCFYEVAIGPYGVITRDTQFDLMFQCKYSGSSVETVLLEVVKLDTPFYPVAAQGPISVQLTLANGQCKTKGCNQADAAYSSFYMDTDYPVTKVLRDPVYVQVQLMQKTDPLLVLTLSRCWVTNSPSPHTLPQWDILIDGCPYKDDRYLSSVVPIGSSSGLDIPTHYRRFSFKMFTFVDNNTLVPQSQQIYIHCSTDVCEGQRCDPSCYRQRRDLGVVLNDKAGPKAVGSVGPILMSQPE